MARVGLMGFGRIGRNVFRLLTAEGDVEVVGDDVGDDGQHDDTEQNI